MTTSADFRSSGLTLPMGTPDLSAISGISSLPSASGPRDLLPFFLLRQIFKRSGLLKSLWMGEWTEVSLKVSNGSRSSLPLVGPRRPSYLLISSHP